MPTLALLKLRAARALRRFAPVPCVAALLGLASASPVAFADSACNPEISSCVPVSGGTCTVAQQLLGQCTPATGGGGAGGQCTAPPGGSPTCGGGPASTSAAAPSSAAGNPINLLNGNKYQEETDLAALPGVLGLELKRYYNSQSSHPGLLGANWRMSYETVLYDFGGEIQILQADGRRLMFQRGIGQNAALCSSPQPQDGQVRIEAAKDGRGPPTYHWRWADGRTLSFSGGSGGGFPLQAITAATGERVTLSYSPGGELTRIRDQQGRTLDFIYASAAEIAAQKRSRALKAIDTPLGRLTYTQDSLGRLTEVGQARDARSAPFAARIYHYEDRYNAGYQPGLTGISIRAIDPQSHQTIEQRLSTYMYDAAGHAILSTKGKPLALKDGKPIADTGIDQVEVRYIDKALPQTGKVDPKSGEAILSAARLGKAILTNSVGQQTQVTSAVIGGHFRLIEMRGPGCSTCGPSDMRYAYDNAGLLRRATKLDPRGKPVRSEVTELDKYGRTARVGLQTFVDDKPQPTQWTERYEYADVTYRDGSVAVAPWPSLVAQPSVITGKEHTLKMIYDATGQVTQMTEAGFSPIGEHGSLTPSGTAIARTTNYRYAKFGTRTLLAEIDGPLPNGQSNSPAESNVTRFEWNSTFDRVVAITLPGGRRVELVADDAGRASRVTIVEGRSRVQLDARYGDAMGGANMPRELSRTAWLVDETGALVAGSRRVSQLAVTRDARGALAGIRVDAASWGADLVLEVQAALDMQRRFSSDGGDAAQGQQGGSSLPDRLDESAGPDARNKRAEGTTWLSSVFGAVGSVADDTLLSLTAGDAQALRLLDDTGQVVAIRNPDQLWQTARRDATGRIVEVRDPRGARLSAEWDSAGRLVKSTRFAPGSQAVEQTISRFYASGDLREELIEDASGARRTTTLRDALGRVLSETTRIEPLGELAATLSVVETKVVYRYDTQGRLLGRTLVGGQGDAIPIDQTLDAQGRLATLSTRGWLPEWLGGGRHLVDRVDWQRLSALDWATGIAHGDTTTDRFPALESSAPGSSNAALAAPPLQVDASSAPAWQVPGRDPDASGLPGVIDTSEGAQRLRWNAASQLVETDRADGGASRYVYDARGRRIVKLVRDAQGRMEATLSLYEDTRLVAEADRNGRITHAYAWIGARPVSQLVTAQGGGWAWLKERLFGATVLALHTERAGRVVSMSEDGVDVWQQPLSRDGLPGEPVSRAKAHQPLRYVGQYHDEESGLDYHGARFYEPHIGRFISPDPSGVADAVSEVDRRHLLDLYAYAAGRPDDYFDPTGAARIRYYAITTNASGAAIGSTQGFTKARWSFIVDDVQAPGTPSGNATLDQLQQKYATQGTGLLYDAGGNFLNGGAQTATWQGVNANMSGSFTTHYGDALISIPQFTMQMSDTDAARLIASYIAADYQQLQGAGSCPLRAQLLPEIKFAPEEVPIQVTTASYSVPGGGALLAQSQRIMACGTASDTDVVQRRLQKYNDTAMLLESAPGQIYKDCQADGCPGHSLDSTTLSGYVASYGQTQFIGSTMVETLRGMRNTVTDSAVRSALRLDDTALWSSVNQQYTRAMYVESAFRSRTATSPDWSHAPAAQQQDFIQRSGLGAAAAASTWNDMNRWKQHPTANLNGEAAAAFGTKVLMSQSNVQTYLMGIFKDSAVGGRFNLVSLALMKKSYNAISNQVDQQNNVAATLADGSANPAWAAKERQIEIELAMRTARMHNGDYNGSASSGSFSDVLAEDSATRGRQYAHRFVNASEYPVTQPANPRQQQPTGDYFSLRCTASIASAKVPRGGLQMTPMQLH